MIEDLSSDKNYTVYHLHSDLSNGVTNVDSVTKYGEYIAKASECGMKALGFAEHGSVFEHYHKKCDIESAGMKYLHGVEAYVTETLEYKVRDNMHCVLIARNYDGYLELNKLISSSFNRKDNHFYYVPRISMEELFATSENIIVTTACVGGVLGKGSESVQNMMISFLTANKERCFLEIGHHRDPKQIEYNKKIFEIHTATGVPLIAGTDTHVLNKEHEEGRSILQKSKNILFDGEENWDLKFKTYDELVRAYKEQNSLPEEVYTEAIFNTNVLADMVKPYTLDTGTKYPHIYDNPEETFREKIYKAIEEHPYALKNHSREELEARVEEEIEVFKATKSIDFMLMQSYLREWEKKSGIQCGYGRGSVTGSMIAYLLGITNMDSLRFGLNFFRFMNSARVTNADIDTDYGGADRDKVKEFLLRDKMGIPTINSAEIITFNTIALKGAVRDVCRALYRDSNSVDYMSLSDEISKSLESNEDGMREKYPEIFRYADIVNGTIVSIGTHPSGVLISDLPINELIGLCSIGSSEYPVSMINMKELDALFYVKLDCLGLDNIKLINDTCAIANIDRLTPDNVDAEDENVWKSIRDDTTLIFQWESNSAAQYLKRFMSDKTLESAGDKIPNFSKIKWLSFGNGLIRPACASFRDSVAKGEFYDNNFEALNEFLAPEAGRIAMQETIMRFLVEFCGYSQSESDLVRRAIAKKKGTESLLPEIEERFINYSSERYSVSKEKCAEVIKPFIQIILDASAYSFSWNHSDSYSFIGYISGYLRYYYPLEFLTSALNIFADDLDKTAEITKYANKVGIQVVSPKWGLSRDNYFFDRDKRTIAKGLSSVKFMSKVLAEELYELAHSRNYTRFMDLLMDLDTKTSINSRQLEILIKIDFFSEFGNQRELLRIVDMFSEFFKKGEAKQIRKDKVDGTQLEPIIKKYAVGVTKAGGVAKSYTLLDVSSILYETEDLIKSVHMPDLEDIIKVKNFYEYMGYFGYTSGKPEDRPKVYIIRKTPQKRRADGRQFGYSLITKSIGSGKETMWTVFNRVYNECPVKEGDIIKVTKYSRSRGYWNLDGYEKCIT